MGAYQLHCSIITFSPEPAFLLHRGKNAAWENNTPLFGLYIYRNVQPQRVGFSATLVMNRVSILAILVIDSTDLAVPASWTFSHFQLSADSLTMEKKYSVPAPQTINIGQSLHF